MAVAESVFNVIFRNRLYGSAVLHILILRALPVPVVFFKRKANGLHFQRVKNGFLQIFSKTFSAHCFDHSGQHIVAETVKEIRTGFKLQGHSGKRIRDLPGRCMMAGLQ